MNNEQLTIPDISKIGPMINRTDGNPSLSYKYMVNIVSCLSFKNKMDAKVYEYLKSLDRTVITSDASDLFMNQILARIKQIEAEFPRCKPYENVHFWTTDGIMGLFPKDYILAGVPFIIFRVLECAEVKL